MKAWSTKLIVCEVLVFQAGRGFPEAVVVLHDRRGCWKDRNTGNV
jgi:hypothetical protein